MRKLFKYFIAISLITCFIGSSLLVIQKVQGRGLIEEMETVVPTHNKMAAITCWSKVDNSFSRVSLLESKATPDTGFVYNTHCVETGKVGEFRFYGDWQWVSQRDKYSTYHRY